MYIFIDLYNVLKFLTYGLIYVVVYILSIWFLGMNNYEKNLIRKPLIKIIKKLALSIK
jgi:hypothetical protein